MLDRTLRSTFRNFSSLFLLAALFSVPASVIFCFIFRNTIAVHELHDTISSFPGDRAVLGVGRQTLLVSRWVGWGIVVAGGVLLIYLVRCTRRILEREQKGQITTVVDALREPPEAKPSLQVAIRDDPASLLGGLAIGLVTGLLALKGGLLLSEILSEGRLWAGVALARGASWALGVPFVLVPWALSSRSQAKPLEVEPDLVL